jgi:hypothetical protein
VVVRFELRASYLLDRLSYHLSYSASPFSIGYFQDSLINFWPGLALNWDPPDFCLLSS